MAEPPAGLVGQAVRRAAPGRRAHRRAARPGRAGLRVRLHDPRAGPAGARPALGPARAGHREPRPRHVVPPAPEPGVLDGWLLYAQEAVAADSGRGLGLGRFFTPDGEHLATVVQEGMIRPPRRSVMSSSLTPCSPRAATRHVRPRPPAAGDQWPTIEFTTPELQYPDRLNAAVELLDATSPSAVPTARRCAPRTARSGPTASCSGGQPGRPGADRRPRAGARQPRAAALAQQPVDGGRLARRPQGRRGGGHHHGRAARPRDRAHRREDQTRCRAGRPPVRRGRAGGARHRGARPRRRGLRRRRRRRPHPPLRREVR